MWIFNLYLISLLLLAAYVAWSGGRTGKASIAVAILATISSQLVASLGHGMESIQRNMFVVDTVTFVMLMLIALLSKRTWPIWVAAFQLNTVLAECAILLSTSFRTMTYYALSTLWAVPTLVVMAIGTWRDRRWEGTIMTGHGRHGH